MLNTGNTGAACTTPPPTPAALLDRPAVPANGRRTTVTFAPRPFYSPCSRRSGSSFGPGHRCPPPDTNPSVVHGVFTARRIFFAPPFVSCTKKKSARPDRCRYRDTLQSCSRYANRCFSNRPRSFTRQQRRSVHELFERAVRRWIREFKQFEYSPYRTEISMILVRIFISFFLFVFFFL